MDALQLAVWCVQAHNVLDTRNFKQAAYQFAFPAAQVEHALGPEAADFLSYAVEAEVGEEVNLTRASPANSRAPARRILTQQVAQIGGGLCVIVSSISEG